MRPTTLLVAAAILALVAGCGGFGEECLPYPDEPQQIGDVPRYAVESVEAARDLAPCEVDWRLHIEWLDGYFLCGDVSASGCYTRWKDGSCAPRIQVKRFPSSLNGALAHELGHHVSAECGLDWNEMAADRFGAQVEMLVWQRHGGL